jgi:hypothetical protein
MEITLGIKRGEEIEREQTTHRIDEDAPESVVPLQLPSTSWPHHDSKSQPVTLSFGDNSNRNNMPGRV